MHASPSPFLTLLCQPLVEPCTVKAVAVMDRLFAELCDRESPHRETCTRDWRTTDDGEVVEVLQFPKMWIRRLDRAAETGAFDRKTADQIATVILTVPPPADISVRE